MVDGVFSMEGDVAPLPEIAELCGRYGARLMVDEAHALGVLGARGAGTCELLGVEDRVDLRMATFSKSLASCGGVIAGPADVIEYLRIQSRPFMFTASAVPAAVGAALAAVRICRSEEGPELFARVLENARYLHAGLEPRSASGSSRPPGWPTGPRSSPRWSRSWSAMTGRRCSCGRRSMRRGCSSTWRIHPAVPPAGRCCARSVMATHDRPTLDRALEVFAAAKGAFEAEHGAARPRSAPDDGLNADCRCLVHSCTSAWREKKHALEHILRGCDLAVNSRRPIGSASHGGGSSTRQSESQWSRRRGAHMGPEQ